MPQPFPENIRPVNLEVGCVSTRRPALAAEAAEVIAHWAQLEQAFMWLFSAMCKGDPAAPSVIYKSIRNTAAQRDAFRALADLVLTDQEQKDLLEALFVKFTSAAKNRDVIAHHLWATVAEIPDGIIFIDPRVSAAVMRDVMAKGEFGFEVVRSGGNPIPVGNVQTPTGKVLDGMRVWKKPDFDAARGRIFDAAVLVTHFMHMVTSQDAQARQRLLDDPEIATTASNTAALVGVKGTSGGSRAHTRRNGV